MISNLETTKTRNCVFSSFFGKMCEQRVKKFGKMCEMSIEKFEKM